MKTAIRLAAAAAAVAALSACEDPAATAAASARDGGVPCGPYNVFGFGREAVPTRDGSIRLGPGTIAGSGPCNTFTATNTATLPQIHISTMNWTDIPCGHKGFEGRLFQALTQAEQAQWQGGVLKIIGPTYITLERTGD